MPKKVDLQSVVTARIRQRRSRGAYTNAKSAEYIARVPQRPPVSALLGRTIISIDPGGTTGLAIRYPDGQWMTVALTRPSELWEFFEAGPDHVVFEIFTPQGRADQYMTYTIELVGGIKALLYALKLTGTAHTPGARVAYMLQAEEMLRPHEHVIHEVDALAHLLAYEYDHRAG